MPLKPEVGPEDWTNKSWPGSLNSLSYWNNVTIANEKYSLLQKLKEGENGMTDEDIEKYVVCMVCELGAFLKTSWRQRSSMCTAS